MTLAEWQKIDGARVAESLRMIGDKLGTSDGELVLDFGSVRALNPAALEALGRLAETAEQKKVRLVLRAVNIDAYKVLKLAKLAPRLGFLN
jgi:anti-anti-sigma regulatory factor